MLQFPNCQVIFGPFRGGERGGGQPGALDDLPGANFDGDDAGEDEGSLRVRTGYERGAVDSVVAGNSEAEGMSHEATEKHHNGLFVASKLPCSDLSIYPYSVLPFAEVVHMASAERTDLGAVGHHRGLREPRLHLASVSSNGVLAPLKN